jgi:carboxypeptidase D
MLLATSRGAPGSKTSETLSFPYMSPWLLPLLLFWSSRLALAKSAADYYVHSLPGAPEGPLLKMHAG